MKHCILMQAEVIIEIVPDLGQELKLILQPHPVSLYPERQLPDFAFRIFVGLVLVDQPVTESIPPSSVVKAQCLRRIVGGSTLDTLLSEPNNGDCKASSLHVISVDVDGTAFGSMASMLS